MARRSTGLESSVAGEFGLRFAGVTPPLLQYAEQNKITINNKPFGKKEKRK